MAFYDCIELEEINALNVTEIYNYSFFNTNIKNIVSNKSYVKDGETYAYFPKLLNCGEGTFSYCDNLTYVYLEKYESLSNYCFAESKNLKTCILPTLLSIGDFAFINCSSLVDFEIGKNVMIIGKTAFVGTGLPNIKLNNNNKYFYTDGNGLYNNKKLITYKSNNKNSYIVLDSVIINGKTYQITTIDDMAFDSALLSRLTIPTNISFIGGNCFKYASVDTIEFYAKNCLKDNYNIEGYVYPIFYETKIKNFNVYDIESIPANFFSKANIENLYIKKYNISYDLTAFNEVKIKNLYLDFSNTIDLNYFSNVIGVRILYGLENIYARTKFNPFTFNNGQSTIYYIDYKNNYYLYSSNSSAKFDIFYSVTDKVVTYDGKYHNIRVNVNISNSYSITY
ncbi:MAG: leucine-rich repeat protein, partial [Clostridia bacterium]|nr:leucine-rich repeat protein [Clostridia bacterium]